MNSQGRWCWQRWLDAVEACDLLSDRDRAVAAAFHKVAKGRGRSRKWVAPWEIDIEPTVGYGDLGRLASFGFMFMSPGNGVFYPELDPLPAKNSIPLNRREKRLIRLLLDGACLWYERRPGYFSPRPHKEPWRLHRSTFNSMEIRFRPADVDSLGKKGLLYRDGVIADNWRDPGCMRYSVQEVRLIGTRAFRSVAEDLIADMQKQHRKMGRESVKRARAERLPVKEPTL